MSNFANSNFVPHPLSPSPIIFNGLEIVTVEFHSITNLRNSIIVTAEVANVILGDEVPHVNGGVIAGAEEETTGDGHSGRSEAGVWSERLVLSQLLIRTDIPKPESRTKIIHKSGCSNLS